MVTDRIWQEHLLPRSAICDRVHERAVWQHSQTAIASYDHSFYVLSNFPRRWQFVFFLNSYSYFFTTSFLSQLWSNTCLDLARFHYSADTRLTSSCLPIREPGKEATLQPHHFQGIFSDNAAYPICMLIL